MHALQSIPSFGTRDVVPARPCVLDRMLLPQNKEMIRMGVVKVVKARLKRLKL
jgi:hypothetical protein